MTYDILFFNPPQNRRGDNLPNLAMLWLASYLRKRGFRAKAFYLGKGYRKAIKKALARYKPRYAAVSCKWYTNLYGAITVAKIIREIDDKIKIITGGNTASVFDKELLRYSDFDIVIRGDAELPLLNILKGKVTGNVTCKKNGKIIRKKRQYIQAQKDLNNYSLVKLKDIVHDPKRLLNEANYIWVGKGCAYNCFYCGGSSHAQKKIFGRRGLIYRPIENVARDIKAFAKYTNFIQLDFQFPWRDDYHIKLCRKIPQKRFICHFHAWHLPTTGLVDQLSKTFKKAIITLDVPTFSENYRSVLSKKKLLKPHFSNTALEKIIRYSDQKRNIELELYSIVGMPDENHEYLKEHIDFARHLVRRYRSIVLMCYMPLSVEPGSILQSDYRKLHMSCGRRNFADYVDFAKRAFDSNITYPFDNVFSRRWRNKGMVHPFGVWEQGQTEKDVYSKMCYIHKIISRAMRARL